MNILSSFYLSQLFSLFACKNQYVLQFGSGGFQPAQNARQTQQEMNSLCQKASREADFW